MDIEIIEEAIQELESSDTTVDNVAELASLYIVKEHLTSGYLPVITNSETVEKEMADILPAYKKFCQVKREYQLNKLPRKTVIVSMKEVCREIEEFIYTLYSSSDMSEERYLLHNTLEKLCKSI